MSDHSQLIARWHEQDRREKWAWRAFVTFSVGCIVFIIAFGIFAAAGGLGPTKAERLDKLEQQVAELQRQIKEKP